MLQMSSQEGQKIISEENFPLLRISVSSFPHFLHLILSTKVLQRSDLKAEPIEFTDNT